MQGARQEAVWLVQGCPHRGETRFLDPGAVDKLTVAFPGELKRDDNIMGLPYVSDNGTIIQGGREYVLLNQQCLRPGVYARRKKSGDIEAPLVESAVPGVGNMFVMRGLYRYAKTRIMTLLRYEASL